MKTKNLIFISVLLPLLLQLSCHQSCNQTDTRMLWWQEARFGMFIHWGLYAIPAGEWDGKTNYAEWIRNEAHIPQDVYDQFVHQFNPLKFDADAWVRMAKDAGMKYIVITSKHHDGFCLFDSKYTDFDIMSTPFQRDIMKELSGACRKQGLKMCWYHSIMDWHHPDYLPRRVWEKDRPAAGADFSQYVQYLKNQLRELLTNYGPIGVMWFDGEWEQNWTHEEGLELYKFCRELQPDVIVNDRVDHGRTTNAMLTHDNKYAGDFDTPEQEIPATGIRGLNWETCMTMNDHWGYNKNDKNFKSTKDLIRKLTDIASKGGNFLLNVGPKADGAFPQNSIDRLREIGEWMKIYSESIYGTQASPFTYLEWGRCTQQEIDSKKTRLFLHVFDWPKNGELMVPGIYNEAKQAFLLADKNKKKIFVSRKEDALVLQVASAAPDTINSVVVLDIDGKPDINNPPDIMAENDIFIDSLAVNVKSDRENVDMRYTMDGSIPELQSPQVAGKIILHQTTTVNSRAFRNGKPVSGVNQRLFEKVAPLPAAEITADKAGVRYEFYKGDWDVLPDFDKIAPIKKNVLANFSFAPRDTTEHFGFRYSGLIKIPADGVYQFFTNSDDGSRLFIDGRLVVNNDGLHGMLEKKSVVPLAKGLHRIVVTFFEKTDGDALEVYWAGPGIEKRVVSDVMLVY